MNFRQPSHRCPSPTKLSAHCISRDKYWLPDLRIAFFNCPNYAIDSYNDTSDRQIWDQNHNMLRACVQRATHAFERLTFIEAFLLRYDFHDKHYGVHPYAHVGKEINADTTVEAEMLELREVRFATQALAMKLAKAANVVMEHAVSDMPSPFPRHETAERGFFLGHGGMEPKVLLRVWDPKSRCVFDDSLGFLCSSWNNCEPIRNLTDLKHDNGKLLEELKSHCQSQQKKTKWISMTASFPFMLKHVMDKYNVGKGSIPLSSFQVRISVICTARMKRLGAVFYSTESLVTRAGGTKHDVEGAGGDGSMWPEHYMAYGFIPKQCVMETLTLMEFRELCIERDIHPAGNYGVNGQ